MPWYLLVWRMSDAFWKSTKFMMSCDWNSTDSSMIVLSVNIWSITDRWGLKPACSSLSLSSIDFFILSSRILQKSFPGTDSKVILRQLLQSDKSPFFGSLKMAPFMVRYMAWYMLMYSKWYGMVYCTVWYMVLYGKCYRMVYSTVYGLVYVTVL